MARKDLILDTELHKKVRAKYNSCIYCGKPLELHQRTIEHIVALDNGGLDEEENLAVACSRCNSDKSNLPLEEYIRLVNEGYFTQEAKDDRKRANNGNVLKYLAPNTKFEIVMINVNDITLPHKHSKPSEKTFNSRKQNYLMTNRFNRTAFVEKIIKADGTILYMLKQGFTNYYVSLDLGLTIMEVVLYNREDRIKPYKSRRKYQSSKKSKILERNRNKRIN